MMQFIHGKPVAGRPAAMPAPFHTGIAGARCDSEPVCALAIAVYGSAPW